MNGKATVCTVADCVIKRQPCNINAVQQCYVTVLLSYSVIDFNIFPICVTNKSLWNAEVAKGSSSSLDAENSC